MIYNNLERLMKKKGINITELSDKTKISRNTLSSLINKNEELTAYKTHTLETLCSYFGVSIFELLVFIDDSFKISNSFSIINSEKYINKDKSISQKGTFDITFSNQFGKEFTKTFDLGVTYSSFVNSNRIFKGEKNIIDREIPLVKLVIDFDSYTVLEANGVQNSLIQDLLEDEKYILKKIIPVFLKDIQGCIDVLSEHTEFILDISFGAKAFGYLKSKDKIDCFMYINIQDHIGFKINNIFL